MFLIETKAELRKSYLAARMEIPPQEIREKSTKIFETLVKLEAFLRSRTVLFYMDFRSEVETLRMIEYSLAQGKRVALPRIIKEPGKKGEMLAFEVKNLDEGTEIGTLGIREPKGDLSKMLPAPEVDLVVVPGVVFDEEGYRIGYGAGYYDRFLMKTGERCVHAGLAYEMQVVDKIPREGHDVPVDIIITEMRIISGKTDLSGRMKI